MSRHSLVASFFLAAACAGADAGPSTTSMLPAVSGAVAGTVAAAPPAPGQGVAIFASGCFWCSESDFELAPGVLSVESGYIGGKVQAPSYELVSGGGTGHVEAVRVVFDPARSGYDALLQWYWAHVDPFDGGGQFCDRGDTYRPAIFPVDDLQRAAAESSKAAMAKRAGRAIAVSVEPAATFWIAEGYHQDFHRTNPGRYKSYRFGCGRDRRIEAVRAELGLTVPDAAHGG